MVDLDSSSAEGRRTKKSAPKTRTGRSPDGGTKRADKAKSLSKEKVKDKGGTKKHARTNKQRAGLPTVDAWSNNHPSVSGSSDVPELLDPWTKPQKLADSLDSHLFTFMGDFNHLVKHINTTFKHLQMAQSVASGKPENAILSPSRVSDLREKTAKPAIKLEDCLSYDQQSNVFQLNTIPLKILLLQDKRHVA